MDPTQNKDSFDSFGPGGNNTGGPVGRRATSVAVPVGGEQGASVTNNGAIFSNPMAPAGLDQMSMNSASSVGGFNQTNFGAISGNNTGDIVIGNDSKKSKKGLVIGLMAVIIIFAIVVLVLMLFSNNKPTTAQVYASWSNYYNVLKLGSTADGDENIDENSYSQGISSNGLYPTEELISKDEYNNYFDSLKDYFNEYYRLANNKVLDLTNYNDLFKAFYSYNMIFEIENNLLSLYKEKGLETAQTFIESNSSEAPYASTMNLFLRRYLEAKLEVFKIYDTNGCYSASNEEACIMETTNDDLTYYYGLANRQSKFMDDYYEDMFSVVFLNETDNINQEMEMLNNEK